MYETNIDLVTVAVKQQFNTHSLYRLKHVESVISICLMRQLKPTLVPNSSVMSRNYVTRWNRFKFNEGFIIKTWYKLTSNECKEDKLTNNILLLSSTKSGSINIIITNKY